MFLACLVEAVEALTIVLAAGTGRDWRSAIIGVVSGLAVLAVVVAVLGPALTLFPLRALRMVIGGLLLIFGLQWLRKAILRASGLKALHDEAGIFATELAAAQAAPSDHRGLIGDWYAFTLSFKGVVLEGLEVAFIALTFGANQHNISLAVVAALAAVLVVTVTGIAVRAPLARVPENTVKFVVGVILTSFGIFWGSEGAGAQWPGGDIALLGIIAAVALLSLGLVTPLRRGRGADDGILSYPGTGTGMRRRTSAFVAFWYDLIVGDDWRLAIGVITALALTYGLSNTVTVPSWWVLPATVLTLLPTSLWRVANGAAAVSHRLIH